MLLLGTSMKYLKNEEEAKDAVQQIFLKALTELQKKYPITYFKSWLYMVAKNHCLLLLRDKNHIVEIGEEMSPIYEEPDILHHKALDSTLDLLEKSLTDLAPDQRVCVQSFYLEKKSYKEITEETGYTLMQVKSFIQNGKRNLKLLIEKKMKQKNGKQ